MKITTDLLRKIKACNRAVNMFNNTTDLHDIDITTINEITVGNYDLFNDIAWLQRKLKNHFKLKKLTLVDSTGHSETYTYDDKGNMLTRVDSYGYSNTYTYDDKGNMLTFVTSNGYSGTYTYDENGNKLTFVDSTCYREIYTYDGKGNMLTRVTSSDYREI